MKRGNLFLLYTVLIFINFDPLAKPISATEDGSLGLYRAADFRLADGACGDCETVSQALWYFKGETLGLPAAQPTGFSRTERAQADVASWLTRKPDLTAHPLLVWLGSSHVVEAATISPDGLRLTAQDGETGFAITPRIRSNLSYWNDSTLKFFTRRPVRLRGEVQADKFVARTVWPLDYKIAPEGKPNPLAGNESLQSLVRFENGGAQSAYTARLLWERSRDEGRQAPGQAVVGLMLNGAQGDDDEAHGGHFAIVTGRFEQDGNYARWLVNNFYNLDTFSEKGIIAAVTPMDKYLMDLNAGQSYYRPSYLLVATFKNERPAALYQAAVNRVFIHFYRHDFVYDHSRENCAGTSIDTFRTLGWQAPQRGVESHLKAVAAYAYMALTERSLDEGRKIYDYLTTETTRLYPAVAFDAMGNDLLALAQGVTGRQLTSLEQDMARNLATIWFVRIPQIPSSRAFGLAPVYNFDQYMKQAPEDRGQWKIIPVDPRPFPEQMRDGLALNPEQPFLVPLPVGVAGICLILILIGVGRKVKNSRKVAASAQS